MGMSSKKHQIPAIRFKGFTDAWEQRKLGDLAEVRTGKAFSSADFNDDGEYLVVTNKNIQDDMNGIASVGDRIDISEETILNNYLLKGNNILVTMDGVNIGKTGKYSNEKSVLAQRVGRLNSEQLEFIYQVTNDNKFLTEMNKLSVGNAIKHISLKQISDYSFAAPINEEEQNKIGTFFEQLDTTIALHQRQLDNYKQLKKSMKQKIFDQKLRFKDADGNDYPKWKRRTLGEISEIIMGQSPDSANYTSNEQDTVLIQGNADLNGGRITPRIYTTQITKTCEAGDIILTVRAPVGDLAIANTRACIGRGVCAIKGDLYIYQYLEMIRDTDGWRKIIQGSTFESINSNDVKDLPIDVPSSEERKKIAEFFKALDRRIEKSTQRVESMKQFRKGLMQQMFVE